MRYSKYKTLEFANNINSADCITNLNQLICAEGCLEPMPLFSNNESVVNMDHVEKKLANNESRNRNKSMDLACIVTNSDNSIQEILLVEFRFNYINMRNLKKDDLIGKISGSISALQNPSNIFNKYIFIFNSNIKQQAIRRFRNMMPNIPNNYVAIDIYDLKSSYF